MARDDRKNRFTWDAEAGDVTLDGEPVTPPASRASMALASARTLYWAEVEAIATALRPQIESGALRGWRDGDADLPPGSVPLHRLEDEVGRRFIVSREPAAVVLGASRSLAEAGFDWRDVGGMSVEGAAVAAMALDVLAFARERGWIRR